MNTYNLYSRLFAAAAQKMDLLSGTLTSQLVEEDCETLGEKNEHQSLHKVTA